MILDLFAGIPVSDFAAGRSWYQRLLGKEPAFLPHATEAVWDLAEHRYVYSVENRNAPGGAIVTVLVDSTGSSRRSPRAGSSLPSGAPLEPGATERI